MTDFKLGDVSFTAPAGYLPRMVVIAAPPPAGGKTAGQMVVKKEASYARNVVVVSEALPEGSTAEAYVERQVLLLQKNLPNFQLLKRGETHVGGRVCPLVETQSTGPEGRLLNSMTAYFVVGRMAYTLSASQLAGLPYQDARSEYLAILASFRAG